MRGILRQSGRDRWRRYRPRRMLLLAALLRKYPCPRLALRSKQACSGPWRAVNLAHTQLDRASGHTLRWALYGGRWTCERVTERLGVVLPGLRVWSPKAEVLEPIEGPVDGPDLVMVVLHVL